MDLNSLMLALDGLITATDHIVKLIEDAKKEGAVLTDEQQAQLDKVAEIRKKVGLPDDSSVPPQNG